MARIALSLLPLLTAFGCSPALVKFDDGGVDSGDDTAPELLPRLNLSTTDLDLGFAAVDESISAAVVAGNAGDAPLDLSAIVGDGNTHFSVDTTAATIEPGDLVILTVTFVAADPGTYGGSLDLASNDPDMPTASVTLTAVVSTDGDGDGYVDGEDCDDADPNIHPGADDTPYDGVDTDCSGTSDYDADGDGYDSADYGGDDCDDTDVDTSPGAPEQWYDGVDEDCDNRSDYDQDGDGHDSDAWGGDDCDDEDAGAYPGNLEDEGNGVDDDCDGLVDETPSTVDEDGDGFSEAEGDCDDANADISPAAVETWYDGIDSDCARDDDYDADGDGYDVDTYGGDDCDDGAAAIHPGATDVPYDGLDKDCSGGSDYDADGDGYDSSAYGGDDCNDANAAINPGEPEIWYDGINEDCAGTSDYDQDGDGRASVDYGGTDCNDLDPTVYPGATETWYDGLDSNCLGDDDYDQDGDGYTSDAWGGTDCDDTVAAVHPGATDAWYDGLDADCAGNDDYDKDGDGYTSSAFGGTDCLDTDATAHPGGTETWYDGIDSDCSGGSDYDQDGDGAAMGTADCNDTNAAIYRAATEVCDSVDNDCDGLVDEGGSTWYRDSDGDGYGNAAVVIAQCTAPSGYVADNTDCDDTRSSTHPGATEVAYDLRDNDCDGATDDMNAADQASWTIIGTSSSHAVGSGLASMFGDEDGDGYSELVLGVPADDVGGTDAGALAWHDYGMMGAAVSVTAGYLHVYGESSGDAFGSSFAQLQDVDGYDSGESEFIGGSPNDDDGGTNAGAAYVFDLYDSGWKTGNRKVSDLDQSKLSGTHSSEYFGYDLAAGDLDADGNLDVVIGAYGRSSSKGEAYLYTRDDGYYANNYDDTEYTYGLRGTASGDEFGKALTTGDVDGDGDDDVVVCAPAYDAGATTSAGGCWLVDPDSMTAYSILVVNTIDDAEIAGSTSSDGIGSTKGSVDLADVDGDGHEDLAVGVPGYDGTETNGGAVAVWFASSLAGSLSVASADALVEGDGGLGTSVALGVLDGSHVGLLAGAPTGGSGGQGIVYAVAGSDLSAGGVLDVTTEGMGSWLGQVASDGFGTTVSNVYDIDGDGDDDFVGGASGWDNGATSAAGKAYVLPLW